MMTASSVLVTGANGFLGFHIARYFAIHGWKTYGFIRHASASAKLAAEEILPIVGDYSNPDSIKGLGFDVIISTTEDNSAYEAHFDELLRLFQAAAKIRKPLILFTSGNKDYGQGGADSWMTEDSPLNPPEALRARCLTAPKIFNHSEFYAVIFRPCMVFGYTGSYYTSILAQGAMKDEIVMDGPPEVIWHGIHVDDVASAYLTVATRLSPEEANGKVFTISSDTYETFKQLAEGVSKIYRGQKIVYQKYSGDNGLRHLMGFSQALSSERLRALGWRPAKAGFLEGLEVYKASFDEALERRDAAVVRLVKSYFGDDAI